MPDANKINRFCYMLCLGCIVSALLIGLLMIWLEVNNEVFFKLLGTTIVLMLASALTLSLNKAVHRKTGDDGE
jgi:hypothetical protein